MSKAAKTTKKIRKFYSKDVENAKRKMRIHVTCISVGIFLAVASTFVSSALVIHFGIVIASAPSIAQEILDRMLDL